MSAFPHIQGSDTCYTIVNGDIVDIPLTDLHGKMLYHWMLLFNMRILKSVEILRFPASKIYQGQVIPISGTCC